MTDPDPVIPVPTPVVTDAPAPPSPVSERARVETPARKMDTLPILYALGLVVLLAAGWYLWTNPPGSGHGDELAAKLDGLNTRTAALEQRPVADPALVQKQLAALEARVMTIEQRPAPKDAPVFDPAPLTARLDAATGDLGNRMAALDRRVAAAEQGVAQVDRKLVPIDQRLSEAEQGMAQVGRKLAPIDQRLSAAETGVAQVDSKIDGRVALLEARVTAADTRLGQVATTIDTTVTGKVAAAEAATTARVNQIGAQLGAQVEAKVGALTDTARKLAQAQAGAAALESGQKLGVITGAPPALARYANVAPPTEFALKQSFGAAADAAARASIPQTEEKPFLDRLWTRAQQSVSVREGDRVLVGDPVTGILARARRALDGNDLVAALMALQGLSGAPRAAMADWIGQAQGVLDARAALAQMARG